MRLRRAPAERTCDRGGAMHAPQKARPDASLARSRGTTPGVDINERHTASVSQRHSPSGISSALGARPCGPIAPAAPAESRKQKLFGARLPPKPSVGKFYTLCSPPPARASISLFFITL